MLTNYAPSLFSLDFLPLSGLPYPQIFLLFQFSFSFPNPIQRSASFQQNNSIYVCFLTKTVSSEKEIPPLFLFFCFALFVDNIYIVIFERQVYCYILSSDKKKPYSLKK